MQANVTACKLMQLHTNLCNYMQAYGPARKLMDLHASSCNALEPQGTFVQTCTDLYSLVLQTCTMLDGLVKCELSTHTHTDGH